MGRRKKGRRIRGRRIRGRGGEVGGKRRSRKTKREREKWGRREGKGR